MHFYIATPQGQYQRLGESLTRFVEQRPYFASQPMFDKARWFLPCHCQGFRLTLIVEREMITRDICAEQIPHSVGTPHGLQIRVEGKTEFQLWQTHQLLVQLVEETQGLFIFRGKICRDPLKPYSSMVKFFLDGKPQTRENCL